MAYLLAGEKLRSTPGSPHRISHARRTRARTTRRVDTRSLSAGRRTAPALGSGFPCRRACLLPTRRAGRPATRESASIASRRRSRSAKFSYCQRCTTRTHGPDMRDEEAVGLSEILARAAALQESGRLLMGARPSSVVKRVRKKVRANARRLVPLPPLRHARRVRPGFLGLSSWQLPQPARGRQHLPLRRGTGGSRLRSTLRKRPRAETPQVAGHEQGRLPGVAFAM